MECWMFGGFGNTPPWRYNRIHSGRGNFLYIDGHVKSQRWAGDGNYSPWITLTADGLPVQYWSCEACNGCPYWWIPEIDPGY
jgi:prepilin-type processing-associated H-X9-DG protein